MKYLLCAMIGFSTMVWASEDDDNFTSYDSIVNDLKADAEDVIPASDPWDELGIYGGLGFATSYIRAEIPGTQRVSGLLKGLEGHFGIDMFTKFVRVEGAFRIFAQENLDDRATATMKEFELRAVYIPAPLARNLVRMGAGMTARYLDVHIRGNNDGDGDAKYSASAPASVFFVGMQRRLGQNVAFGPDVAYRASLVEDSYMKPSWDLCLKLDANF
jgi:hypothetical protein